MNIKPALAFLTLIFGMGLYGGETFSIPINRINASKKNITLTLNKVVYAKDKTTIYLSYREDSAQNTKSNYTAYDILPESHIEKKFKNYFKKGYRIYSEFGTEDVLKITAEPQAIETKVNREYYSRDKKRGLILTVDFEMEFGRMPFLDFDLMINPDDSKKENYWSFRKIDLHEALVNEQLQRQKDLKQTKRSQARLQSRIHRLEQTVQTHKATTERLNSDLAKARKNAKAQLKGEQDQLQKTQEMATQKEMQLTKDLTAANEKSKHLAVEKQQIQVQHDHLRSHLSAAETKLSQNHSQMQKYMAAGGIIFLLLSGVLVRERLRRRTSENDDESLQRSLENKTNDLKVAGQKILKLEDDITALAKEKDEQLDAFETLKKEHTSIKQKNKQFQEEQANYESELQKRKAQPRTPTEQEIQLQEQAQAQRQQELDLRQEKASKEAEELKLKNQKYAQEQQKITLLQKEQEQQELQLHIQKKEQEQKDQELQLKMQADQHKKHELEIQKKEQAQRQEELDLEQQKASHQAEELKLQQQQQAQEQQKLNLERQAAVNRSQEVELQQQAQKQRQQELNLQEKKDAQRQQELRLEQEKIRLEDDQKAREQQSAQEQRQLDAEQAKRQDEQRARELKLQEERLKIEAETAKRKDEQRQKEREHEHQLQLKQQEITLQREQTETAFYQKMEEFSDLPLSKFLAFLIKKLEVVESAEFQGQNHSDMLTLFSSLKSSYQRNSLLSPEKQEEIAPDVLRINQIESVMDLYTEKIRRVKQDHTLDDDEQQMKIDFWIRLRDKDIQEIETAK